MIKRKHGIIHVVPQDNNEIWYPGPIHMAIQINIAEMILGTMQVACQGNKAIQKPYKTRSNS